MDSNQKAVLWAQLSMNVNDLRMLLKDFEEFMRDKEMRKKFPCATWSYTHNIVILLEKIFSRSKRENFRLVRFKELGNKEINEKIDRLFTTYKELIDKVSTNRNRLMAHTDINFYEILFSNAEVDRLEEQFGITYPRLRAKSKAKERYTPADMHTDAEAIFKILDILDNIWNEALMLGTGPEK